MKYLQKMIEEKKEKKRKKTLKKKQKQKKKANQNLFVLENGFDDSDNLSVNTIVSATHKWKKKKNHTPIDTTPMKIPQSNQLKEPVWGCLKNGKKPTYSQYKKTLKKRPVINSQPIVITEPDQNNNNISINTINTSISSPILERKRKLEELKNKMNNEPVKNKKLMKRNKTIKIYNLGKNKKKRSVGVLIKSGKTRKKVKIEHNILKKKALSDIKYYLRKHNLIRVGTTAPENLLRKIYENSNLSGDITNHNEENLIHNFFSDN